MLLDGGDGQVQEGGDVLGAGAAHRVEGDLLFARGQAVGEDGQRQVLDRETGVAMPFDVASPGLLPARAPSTAPPTPTPTPGPAVVVAAVVVVVEGAATVAA
ncbi:hypothetical protein ACIQWA_30840 [Kitasatospora sp. NPDC098652]|uniref:hypothetical protein n=1 Tax=Kitasatospora sp. NPDC098652 TaxID=3364095 RepID=UPI0038175705